MLSKKIKAIFKCKEENKLRWDQLIGFGVVALVLWILVQNNDVARGAASTILLKARDSIVSLFDSMGSF